MDIVQPFCNGWVKLKTLLTNENNFWITGNYFKFIQDRYEPIYRRLKSYRKFYIFNRTELGSVGSYIGFLQTIYSIQYIIFVKSNLFKHFVHSKCTIFK